MNVRRLTAACLVVAALAAPDALARDPMRPPQAAASRGAASVASPVLLSAVIGDGARRIAIVNGRVMRAGETLDGVTVERIDASGIVYRRGGVQRELKLASAPVVKRPAAQFVARGNSVKEPAAVAGGPLGEQ